MMTITKDMLKYEIDHIQDQYVDALYRVIKAFEYPAVQKNPTHIPETETQWHTFLDRCAGSCADVPLLRGEQELPEQREALV
jgi:hypothetical protein